MLFIFVLENLMDELNVRTDNWSAVDPICAGEFDGRIVRLIMNCFAYHDWKNNSFVV